MSEDPTHSPDEEQTKEHFHFNSTREEFDHIDIPPEPVLPPKGSSHDALEKYVDELLAHQKAKIARNNVIRSRRDNLVEGYIKGHIYPDQDKGDPNNVTIISDDIPDKDTGVRYESRDTRSERNE